MRTIAKRKLRLLVVALLFIGALQASNFYWVNGAGKWNDQNHWSNIDGGEGGAGVPTISDAVFFTQNSGLLLNGTVLIDSIAQAESLDFSTLQHKIIFKGNKLANLMVTGKIMFSGNVINEFSGYVVMVGSQSDYKMIVFQPGEFRGKNSLIDIYKNKRSSNQTLAITSITPNITDATCGCNGEINLTINGGTGPFSYSWFPNVPPLNGDGTNTVIDLCPGKYNVIVTDLSDGAPYVESDIEVDGPSPLTIQHLVTDSVNCFGGSDGFISTLVFGGVAPYTLLWNDAGAQSTTTATGLPIGDYQLQVTDFVGCMATSTVFTVYEPTALTSSITDTNFVTCFEVCDGDATVTAAGGSPAYSYDWYDVPGTPSTPQASGLCDGTFHVEVSDSRGCLDTSEVIITEPTELVASIGAFSDVVCFGDANGTANSSVVGGTPVYTYDWYDVPGNPSLPNVTNLSPGTYNVEVTDDNGCLDTAQVAIVQPTLLTSSITDTVHVLCNSLCTGEIEVTAVGGTIGYSYDWYDAAGQTADRVTAMCAGTYNVEITDGNGCLDTSNVTLLQPASAITTSITDTTHNLCFSDCDGIAIVTPIGGTAGYTYDWYDVPGGDADSTASSLCAGTYNVEVTDANGCSDTSTIEITEPVILSSSAVLTQVDCKSNCNGEIDLTPAGGTTAYTFDWYDVVGTPTSEDITGLCAGTYNVEITDANGCLDTLTSTITEPDTLVASIIASNNILCFGLCTGSATVDQIGGTAPYFVDWYDHPTTPTSSIINNVCAGTYNVEITDSEGCVDTTEIILTEPASALTTSITDTVHIDCKNNCIGEAEVTALGGTGGYNYDWYDVPTTPAVPRALNLCDGTYHVEVTDGNGCLDTSEVIIEEPAAGLSSSIVDSVNATCNGLCNGLAFVTYAGGTSPYTLDWYSAGNQVTDTAFTLCAATHYVEITDANGCVDTATITIDEPAPMVITINSATLPTCYGDCDGVMSVTPSGGTSPYLYSWYDVVGTPTTPSAGGQCAGSYNVRVEDTQGCIDTALVILSEPDSLEHTIDAVANLACKNTCDGSATMSPIGGTAGYTVTWYDVVGTPTGTTINTLCAGTWNFELEDANGCLDSGTVTLTEPLLELTSSITDTTHNVCFGDCLGDATVTGAGGTGLILYDWYDSPDLDTDVQAENLCAGTYNVELEDGNGCLDTASVVITEPLDITATTAVQNLGCGAIGDGKASVAPSGGTAPYTYDWYDAGNQTNDTATGLAAGTFNVEVTDAAGCIDTFSVVVTAPDSLVASIRADTIHIDCFGNTNGFAFLEVTGGTATFTYNWYDVAGTPTTPGASNLIGGIYHGEVTDFNGCKDTAEVIITEPTLLVSSADSAEASCFGVCDGRVWTDYSGGVSPYTVDWYNLPGTPTSDTVDNVCTGSYNVEITDANGCLDTAEVEVTAPVVVSSSITDTTHNICAYSCLGEAIVTPVGGVLPYSYDWFDIPGGDTDSTGNNLCVGTFHVEVSDFNGCVDTSEVTITSTSPDLTTSTDSILTSCAGLSDGSAIVLPSGGVGPYTIDWFENGNQTTDTITGLASGNYRVEVTDFNGCVDTVTAVVTDPPSLSAVISDTTHILCNSAATGEAIVTPTGGTAVYTYSWFDAPGFDTDSTASNLPAGTYQVKVTDANGCLDTGIVTITEELPILIGTDSIEATCTGICTGAAIVVPSGGVGPYSFDWYDASNQTNDTAFSLCAGIYHAEVTDANGCVDTGAVTVTEPVTIAASVVDSSATSCNSGSDGWAAVSGTGGTLPYSYWWSDALNQTNDTAFNISAGTYQAAVTDFNGCSDTVSITVLEPTAISAIDSLVNVSCNGACDGYISLNVSGGTPGYSHSWSNGVTDTLISLLCPGTFSDTITDGAGCIDTFTYVITEPDSLKAPISDTTHITCSYSSDGEAIVTPTGGTGNYTYDWYDVPGGDVDSVASGLVAGTYHVEVTDANGCLDTGEVTLTVPLALALTTDSVEATCSGICNGVAIVDVTGGTGPYTYDWYENGNLDNDSVLNVCADTFGIAITDAVGCVDSAMAIVTQPVSVTASVVDSGATSCNGGSDGWAAVSGVGGSLPYSYWWSDALNQTNDTAFNISAGTYQAAVTDLNGCSDTVLITVLEPTAINPVDSLVNITCKGSCDGYVSLDVSGGATGYTHSWSNGSTDTLISTLCPGAYSDTITDGVGCVDTFTFVITEPDSLKAPISDTSHVTCSYSTNGQAIVTPTGGTAIYTYDWYDVPGGDADSVASGLVAGTYHVEVTDANGCLDTGEVTLTVPLALALTTDSVEATCSGICNGIAIVSVAGGTSPYSYDWYENGNLDNDSVLNVCADTFGIAITDAVGCVDSTFAIVTQPVSVTTIATDQVDAICYDDTSGWAAISGSGGTQPYSYWWSDGSTNDTIMNIAAGTYRAAVTDFNGCSDTIDIIIGEPAPWSHSIDTTNASCYSVCDGILTVTAGGGNGPYIHSWNTGSGGATIINLCAGSYIDTISDFNGCRDTITIVVAEPDSLEAQPDVVNNVLCFGENSAQVESGAIGGTAPYSFDWGSAQINSLGDTATNIGAGVNSVIVTDANGCKDTNDYVITEPTVLNSTITDTVHANCVCNAEATVTPTGGTPGYTYLWNDLASQTDSTALGLCTGDYEVVVTDANGCIDTAEVTIRDTSLFAISITDTINTSCFGVCDGGAIVTPLLGTLPYSYVWNNPAATTDSTVTGLCAGNVAITVTDGEGCIRFANVTISEPSNVVGTPMFSSPLCFGDTNAVVWTDVAGGTAPYTHSWDTISVNDTVYNVGIGSFTDTITDVNGCKDTVVVTVTEPQVLISNPDSINIDCNGNGNGVVWSAPTGGTVPYAYSWSDIANSTTDTVFNLVPGIYQVAVTDFNGCTDTDSVSIVEPVLLTSSITDTSHVSCLCTGTAIVTPAGGTTPYSYLWSDATGQTDSTATNLCAGNYFVEITDANGCTDTSFVIIRDTSNFVTSIVDTSMVTCFGSCNGSAKARAENGVQPYTFAWNNPGLSSDSIASGLCAGNVSVTISDAIGCTHNLTVNITQPTAIDIAFSDTSVSCNGLCDGSIEASVTGGIAPYTLLWNDPDSSDSSYVDSLCPGSYNLAVTDSNGCVFDSAVAITEPATLIAFINPFAHISCFGNNDGSASALGTGGTTPYSYLWSTAETSSTVNNLAPGIITVMITDTNGCADDTSFMVIEPVLLASSITDTVHILCGGQSTGEAIVTPTGGTLPYTYSWYDAPAVGTDSTITNLPAGTYHVEIIDANGCRDTSEVTITEPAIFSASITSQTATSCLVCDGTAFVTPVGGTLPYSYAWYNAPTLSTDSSATDLCASLYNVLVTDGNGCSVDVLAAVVGPGGLTAGVFDTTMVSCNNLCDGLAVATGVGGTAPYNYTWDDLNGTSNDSIQSLCADTFNVTVEDGAGCLAYASVIISEPEILIATITDTNSTGCFAPCAGDATVSVTGGSGPYSYLWNDWSAQSTAQAVNLCAAQYTATVTDVNGCSDTAVGFVTGPNGLTVAVDSVEDISCFGNCDGNTAITAQGGVGSYSYLWTDPSSTTDSVVTGLCTGAFTGQVTDGNGCVAFANINIVEPPQLISAIADSVNLLCNGENDGWALVAYAGGTAPYSILWNDGLGQTTDTAKGLSAGTYTVTVTDANGCISVADVIIEEPSGISVSTSNIQHVACTGFCIGEATVSATGGVQGLGYSYLWSPSGQTSATATNLCSGWHTFTVTDSNNCSVTDSVEIEDLNNFTAVLSGTGVSCFGDCDGTVLSTPSGGSSPYVHSWTNGNSADSQLGLCPGIYTDTVFDNNGCFFVDSFEVIEPVVFTVSIIDSTNLKCFGVCNGKAVAAAAGGTLPFTYTWYNAPVTQVNDTAVNLCADEYFVLAEDANGCSAEDTVTITEPSEIVSSIDAQTNISCKGDCNGSATVSAVGGEGTLIFTWPDASLLTTRIDLCEGAYDIVVTDDSLCVDTINLMITSPDSLLAIITDTSHIVCAAVCDGDATVGETGGTGPFTYDWYDVGNVTQNQITNQCIGTYHVEVTDSKGCIDTAEVSINDVNVLKATIANQHISCFGLCDGKLVANPIGGIAPYTYTWNNAITIDSITDLCEGNYFVTITDDNACQITVASSIIEPALLVSSIVDSANLDCFEICDGYATVSPSGGTGPYTFVWDDVSNQTGITATGLCAQTYKVVVEDARGCQDSSQVFLTEPTELLSSLTVTQANCTNTADGSIDLTSTGGTGIHNYNWTNDFAFTSSSEDPSSLAIGNYYVIISDGNGCTRLDTAVVTELNAVLANAGEDTTICDLDTVLLVGTGGTTYSWSIGSNNDSITVQPGTTTEYILTVFNNGCTDKDSVVVNVNALPNISAFATDYLILEGNTTQLTVNGGGNNATYDWNPPLTLNDPTINNPIASPLENTSYIVTGTDENGCMDTANVFITVATSIVFPDGITPNGDGLNDTWRIELIEEFPNNVVKVYNRWGQIVFESKGYVTEWNGLVDGRELPVGTYYYLIDLGTDLPKYTGPITLMR